MKKLTLILITLSISLSAFANCNGKLECGGFGDSLGSMHAQNSTADHIHTSWTSQFVAPKGSDRISLNVTVTDKNGFQYSYATNYIRVVWTTNDVGYMTGSFSNHSQFIAVLSNHQFSVRYPGNTNLLHSNPREVYAVRKAMKEYRKEHPICEWNKKSKDIQVHHILPVSLYPQYAASKWNFISLSKKAHLQVGHAGNYKCYVPNVRNLCNKVKVVER